MERELAEAAVADAELSGDEKRKSLSELKVQKTSSKIVRKHEELQEVVGKKVKATKKDLDAVFHGDEGKKLTIIKANKIWIPILNALIENDGVDENGEKICNKSDAELLRLSVIMGWNRNEYDVKAVLKEHYLNGGGE